MARHEETKGVRPVSGRVAKEPAKTAATALPGKGLARVKMTAQEYETFMQKRRGAKK